MKLVDVVSHLEHYAFTDTLTQIGNRREFENTFIRENALFLRKNNPLRHHLTSIISKPSTTATGTTRGMVLVHTAELLRHYLRTSDQVCRWGAKNSPPFFA